MVISYVIRNRPRSGAMIQRAVLAPRISRIGKNVNATNAYSIIMLTFFADAGLKYVVIIGSFGTAHFSPFISKNLNASVIALLDI